MEAWVSKLWFYLNSLPYPKWLSLSDNRKINSPTLCFGLLLPGHRWSYGRLCLWVARLEKISENLFLCIIYYLALSTSLFLCYGPLLFVISLPYWTKILVSQLFLKVCGSIMHVICTCCLLPNSELFLLGLSVSSFIELQNHCMQVFCGRYRSMEVFFLYLKLPDWHINSCMPCVKRLDHYTLGWDDNAFNIFGILLVTVV